MLRLLATGVVLLAAGAVLGSPPAAPPDCDKTPEPAEFIRTAITHGLEEDGVPLELVAQLVKRDDFHGKCNLCNPSKRAFMDYSERRVQPVAQKGRGLTEEMLKRLKSDKVEVRQPALRELIARYMDRAYEMSTLTKEQKDTLQVKLEDIRKAMGKALPREQKFCPSCDGACRLVPKL